MVEGEKALTVDCTVNSAGLAISCSSTTEMVQVECSATKETEQKRIEKANVIIVLARFCTHSLLKPLLVS